MLPTSYKWLVEHSGDMKILLNPKSSLEEQAVMAINIRNDFVAAARNLIYDTRITQKLNEQSTLWLREEIFAQYSHLSGAAKYQKIIDDAFNLKDFKVNGKDYRGLEHEAMLEGACFVAGTLVHTDKGLIPIELIKVGDMVLSKSESGEGEQDYKPVVHIFEPTEATIVQLSYYSLSNPSNDLKEELLYLTVGHLIWVVEDFDGAHINKWIPALDIEPGSKVILKDGTLVEIGSILEVLNTNDPNVGYVYDLLNETPELLIDFSDNQIKPYYIEHLVGLIDLGRCYQKYHDLKHSFSDEVIVGDYNFEKVKAFFDFFEIQGQPDVYKNLVYNFEVADFHTYYVNRTGVWVHNIGNCPPREFYVPWNDNGQQSKI